MKFNFSGDMIVCSLVLVAVLVGVSSAEVEQSKTRRGGGGTAGLFAFPRVGRSDPNLLASSGSGYDGLFPVSYEEYDDYPKISEIKRANLMAFPRVGRSDSQLRKWARMAALQQSLDKRTAPSANSGLWFGPRLGRIQKRSVDDDELKDLAQKLISHYEQNFDVEPPLLMDNDDDMILEN